MACSVSAYPILEAYVVIVIECNLRLQLRPDFAAISGQQRESFAGDPPDAGAPVEEALAGTVIDEIDAPEFGEQAYVLR